MGGGGATGQRRPAGRWARGARAAAALWIGATVLAGCRPAAPPSLVLITLDTTRADALGCYTGDPELSPALDAFAEAATLYRRAYATSSWTLPSHASMLTGLLPREHGAKSLPGADTHGLGYGVRPLPDGLDTLAERLRSAGYRTAAVVAGPALRRELGLAQGFEIYRDELDTPGRRFHGKRAEQVWRQAVEALEGFGAEPFFLFVNFFDPHAPYQPPGFEARAAKRMSEGELYEALGKALRASEPPVEPGRLPEEVRRELARLREGYRAEVRYMDDFVGRLLRELGRRRPDGNLAIAITGDHGESFGEHFYWSHGAHLYEDNVRVPFLLRAPHQRRGAVVDGPVQNHRIANTFLEYAGLEPLPGAPSLAAGGSPEMPIVLEVARSELNVKILGPVLDRDLVAVLRWPFKAILSSTGHRELYDLEDDPLELQNLADSLPERLAGLEETLAAVESRHPPRYGSTAPARLDPETEEALRALGYIE